MFESNRLYVRCPVVCVRSVSRLRRTRKPTASKDHRRLTTKAGDIWQEWAGGRPEGVFARPWNSDVLLGAVDLVLVDAMMRCQLVWKSLSYLYIKKKKKMMMIRARILMT